jgi:protein-S-isoprenylcysteine O-methyltransferase Ste14
MNTYQRIFGSGPSGALIAATFFVLAYHLEDLAGLPAITRIDSLRYGASLLLVMAGVAVIIWSLVSLPPKDRGRTLVQTGAFRYFRHPLYAGFLSFIDFGIAIYMNQWIYIFWALLLFPVSAWHVRYEEGLMQSAFGEEYTSYCNKTWRFFPKP